ncbi:hypothetical protein KY326_01645 [Candidatus Woesearchaeota archaeon]|nr:hypothetical protein [Candidatus Woesearchaeota archaeon]
MGDIIDTAVRNLILKAGLEPDDILRAFLRPIVISGHLDPEDELERWKFLRSIVGDFSSYDIFFAQDITQRPDKTTALLYEGIEDTCRKTGHQAFVPSKSVGFPGDEHELQPRDSYVLINDIMIPNTKVVLAYIGLQSTDVGMMMGRTIRAKKPMIYICEEENEKNVLELYDYPKVVGFVKFTGLADCCDKLETEINKFFDKENKKESAPFN